MRESKELQKRYVEMDYNNIGQYGTKLNRCPIEDQRQQKFGEVPRVLWLIRLHFYLIVDLDCNF